MTFIYIFRKVRHNSVGLLFQWGNGSLSFKLRWISEWCRAHFSMREWHYVHYAGLDKSAACFKVPIPLGEWPYYAFRKARQSSVWYRVQSQWENCSETTLTGESQIHISASLGIWTRLPPWGFEPGSLVTGSKRVVHWTSETWWEWGEIAGSIQNDPLYPTFCKVRQTSLWRRKFHSVCVGVCVWGGCMQDEARFSVPERVQFTVQEQRSIMAFNEIFSGVWEMY
jgi:hypothetical protein